MTDKLKSYGGFLKNSFRNPLSFATLLAFLLFAAEFLIVLAAIFLSAYNGDNMDCATLFVHAKEIWRTGKLFVPGWRYITTVELDTPLIFAVPLYGLLGDIFIAFKLADLIFLLLLIWTVVRLCRKEDNLLYTLLALDLILIPYSTERQDYFTLVYNYGAQYSFKVLIPLMIIVLLTDLDLKKLADIHFFAISSFMIYLTALSSGLFVFGSGVIGIILGAFFYFYMEKKLPDRKFVLTVLWVFLITGVGYLVLKQKGVSIEGSLSLRSPEYLAAVPTDLFKHLCIFFGLEKFDHTDFMSLKGIEHIARVLMVLIYLISIVIMQVRLIRRKLGQTEFLLFSLSVWGTLLIAASTKSTHFSRTRYFFIAFVPCFFLMAKLLMEWISQENIPVYRYLTSAGILGFLAFVFALSLPGLYRYGTRGVAEYEEIGRLAQEAGVDYIYWPDPVGAGAEVTRLLMDDTDIRTFKVNKDSKLVCIDNYYWDYDKSYVSYHNALVVVELLNEEQVMHAYDIIPAYRLEYYATVPGPAGDGYLVFYMDGEGKDMGKAMEY